MFYAIADVALIGTAEDLDELIDHCQGLREDVAIWDGGNMAAVILAPAQPGGIPVVLKRHELEAAGLIVADRWTLAAGLEAK